MDIKNYLSSSSTDPKQILKIVLIFAAVLLVLWLIMVSRMDFRGDMEGPGQAVHTQSDSLRPAITQNEGRPQRTESERPSIFFNAFTTFVILIGMLALVWFWSRTNGSGKSTKQSGFNEIGGHPLGQGAQLKIVEINNEIWVMGITGSSVNLLHRYSRDEWTEKVEQEEPREESTFYKLFKGEKK
ncbi:hypothetical protein DYD21_01600 [Rhodohalobacter sp. SW132]|uniref:flagellar biosynthetic protein FliO n=1 Tax=Rhodohalobacter sp. SW132 TaxID=2293433 RepID=UPI000E26A698|nr:flagellar biosynthetic protein FliO [Rhodohalobacter sp. SW132]REL38670.1 hypothetical protein DYD21_01600 [Rhodohalobacter sp. SW132]